MTWTNVTIIVPASLAPLARGLAAAIADESGAGMFVRELGAATEGPATHYISAGYIHPQMAALLTDADAMFAAAQAAQAPVTLEQCRALVEASVVRDGSQEPWQATLDEVGLVFVRQSL